MDISKAISDKHPSQHPHWMRQAEYDRLKKIETLAAELIKLTLDTDESCNPCELCKDKARELKAEIGKGV